VKVNAAGVAVSGGCVIVNNTGTLVGLLPEVLGVSTIFPLYVPGARPATDTET
jgi:hypothetical protein